MSKTHLDVLVVGGAGYLGNSIINYLLTQKDGFLGKLDVLDSLEHEPMYRREDINNFFCLNICDNVLVNELLPDYDVVIWLAGVVGEKACSENQLVSEMVNVRSLEKIKYDGRLIYVSSCSVYGNQKDSVNERTEPAPIGFYAKQKLEAEKLIGKITKNNVILRLGTLFGFSDGFGRPRFDLAVNNFILQAYEKGGITFFGGDQWRPFIHVKDVAHAIKRLTFGDPRKETGTFILSSFNMQIREAVETINSYFSGDLNINESTDNWEPRNYAVDTTKAGNHGILQPLAYFDIYHAIEQHGLIQDRIADKYSEYFYN